MVPPSRHAGRTLPRLAAVLASAILTSAAATVASAGPVRLTVRSTEAPSGGEVRIAVEAADAVGLISAEVDLVFDPAVLDAYGSEAGSLLPGAHLVEGIVRPDKSRFHVRVAAAAGTEGATRSEGVLLAATFRVKGPSGASCEVRVENARGRLASGTADVPLLATSGRFTVAVVEPPVDREWTVGALGLVAAVALAVAWVARRRRRAVPPPA